MKTILVTGGCGFIGSHTCLELLRAAYNIIVIDSNINSTDNSLKKISEIRYLQDKVLSDNLTFFKGDIRNKELIEHIFSESIRKKNRIEAVVHFAGLKAVRKSVEDPLLYWENNVSGSLVLLQVMQKFNCFNIVFSSSATVYGPSSQCNLSEDSELKPNNPYGETKLAIEKILNDIFKSSNQKWRIANLRYFNPIGAHSSGLIGEHPNGIPDNLFPYICMVASGNLSHLNIFGNDWPTFDGTCIRDYIHVQDLAEAHCHALKFLLNNQPQILNLNIGSGIGTSVLQLVNTFIEQNECEVPYEFVSRRIGDVPFIVADNNFAISRIGWKPKRDLKAMCRDGWLWQIKNPNGYK